MTYSEHELEFTFAKNRKRICTINDSKRVKSAIGRSLSAVSFKFVPINGALNFYTLDILYIT